MRCSDVQNRHSAILIAAEAHLRWSRMSALGKLTESRHGTRSTLTAANRAAHEAVSAHVTTELADLADVCV